MKIEDGFLLKTTKNDYKFADLWAFKVDAQIEDLVFAENEVETAEWVNFDRIVELKQQGIFVDSNNITKEDYEKAKEMLG